jgi:hypothetical protein
MAGKFGVKETLEANKAIQEVGLFFLIRLKDGAGFDDLVAAWDKRDDDEFVKVVSEGYKGWDLIDDELSELDGDDIMNLGKGTIETSMATWSKYRAQMKK